MRPLLPRAILTEARKWGWSNFFPRPERTKKNRASVAAQKVAPERRAFSFFRLEPVSMFSPTARDGFARTGFKKKEGRQERSDLVHCSSKRDDLCGNDDNNNNNNKMPPKKSAIPRTRNLPDDGRKNREAIPQNRHRTGTGRNGLSSNRGDSKEQRIQILLRRGGAESRTSGSILASIKYHVLGEYRARKLRAARSTLLY